MENQVESEVSGYVQDFNENEAEEIEDSEVIENREETTNAFQNENLEKETSKNNEEVNHVLDPLEATLPLNICDPRVWDSVDGEMRDLLVKKGVKEVVDEYLKTKLC